jgi:hypothetical protein
MSQRAHVHDLYPIQPVPPGFYDFLHFRLCPRLIRGVRALSSPYQHAVETLNALGKNPVGTGWMGWDTAVSYLSSHY